MSGEGQKLLAERDLLLELEELKNHCSVLEQRLAESEGTLKAIHSGEVDAILVSTPDGDRIFTLKGAEEPYRILFEQMSEGAVTVSGEGRILYCNHSFADVAKIPLEKAIGTPFADYLRISDRRMFRDMLERSASEPVRDELTFMTREGTPVPVQLSISSLAYDGLRTYCIILTDLTERAHAEEALQRSYEEAKRMVEERTRELSESEARYRSIYEKSLDAILLVNDRGGIVGANPAARLLFEMTVDEAMSVRQDDIIVDGHIDLMSMGRALSGKDRIEMEYRRKDGATFVGETTTGLFTDVDGSLITMLII